MRNYMLEECFLFSQQKSGRLRMEDLSFGMLFVQQEKASHVCVCVCVCGENVCVCVCACLRMHLCEVCVHVRDHLSCHLPEIVSFFFQSKAGRHNRLLFP